MTGDGDPWLGGVVVGTLAARAPERRPSRVALRVGANRRATAPARPAGSAVDVAERTRPLDAGPHQPVGGVENREQLPIGHVGELPPRRHAGLPERLRLPEIADPGDEALVDDGLADLPLLRGVAEALEHPFEVGRLGKDVGPEPAQRAGAPNELEHRAVPEDRLVLGAAQHEPGAADPPRAARLDAPAAGHAQVAAEHEVALEAEEQVLPDRLDGFEAASVKSVGEQPSARPGMRRLHLELLSDEDLQTGGGAVERVAFRHDGRVVPASSSADGRDAYDWGMTRPFIGVRWWLGAAFAVVAATSTAIVVSQFSSRSEDAFRNKAQETASTRAAAAARSIDGRANLTGAFLQTIANRQQLELRVYRHGATGPGGLLAEAAPSGIAVQAQKLEDRALVSAEAGRTYAGGTGNGAVFVVGMRLAAGDLVALSSRPDVAAALSAVNDQAFRAGVIAGVIGVLVGLLLAQLISLRLRRLSAAAEALALGDFESPLRYNFRDEFGALAQSFDRMRRQLRRSFRRLEVERDRLRMLLERLHEGVLTIDQDLVVHFANAEARRLLGGRLAEGDALPEPWQGFALRDFAQRLFEESGAPVQVHVAPDEERAYGLTGIPAQPETEWALLVIDDLTEQERRELAEREFVSNAAHELRTPLTTIIGAVEVLQSGAKDDPAQRDRFLAHIEREAGRLARLARALLTLARAHSGQEQPRAEAVELVPLLREVADALRPHDGVAIEVECAESLAAHVNRDLLEQALRNIAENAAKHTTGGHVVLRALADETTVSLEVEDSGPGMSAETQRHVFDRFYRGERDAEGFGLGLAIVRESVRTLGGRIELDSSPGEGTCFRIVLEGARVREEALA
jgi:signal transduction histidine kinase/HAMP domain-containing protein